MDLRNIEIKSADFKKPIKLNDYLCKLLQTLWAESDEFSGKRPFGNSGWQYDVYASLIEVGIIQGKLDEDGYVLSFNTKEADKIMFDLIKNIFEANSGNENNKLD